MHETARRLIEAAREIGGIDQHSRVAIALGESQQTLKHWEARGVSKNGQLKACALWGLSPVWLRDGVGPMQAGANPIINTDDPNSVAHALSHRQPIMDIQEIEWERLSVTKLEGMFAMEIRGEALAPRFLPGQSAIWQAGDSAQDGQPVLIELEGSFFLRFFEGRGATWAGVADRTGHRELQPEQGAKIVARLRYIDLG